MEARQLVSPGTLQPTLTLTEFPDPDGEATFFKVPNPVDHRFVADEVLAPKVKAKAMAG